MGLSSPQSESFSVSTPGEGPGDEYEEEPEDSLSAPSSGEGAEGEPEETFKGPARGEGPGSDTGWGETLERPASRTAWAKRSS